jgi:two-component system, OmpR family, response regulator
MTSPNRKILCVDDDEDTCEILSVFFKDYQLTLAHTYQDALTKSLSGGFDVVLMDSHLPDGSGIDLCKEIREADASLPIVFYSADAQAANIEEAMLAGANAYLTKPVTPDEVGRAIEQVLNHPTEDSV